MEAPLAVARFVCFGSWRSGYLPHLAFVEAGRNGRYGSEADHRLRLESGLGPSLSTIWLGRSVAFHHIEEIKPIGRRDGIDPER